MTDHGPQPPGVVNDDAREGATLPFDDGFGEQPRLPGTASQRRHRGRRVLVTVGVVVLMLLGALAGTVFLLSETLGNNVDRVPNVFGALDENSRPAATAALTFLLVGTDSRSTEPTTGTDAAPGVDAGSQRSDVVMLARINPDRAEAAVVSIPRDSWVDIPGRGMNKINAAYAFGGPTLLIETVENFTNLRVDHFAVIDFAGFQAMVDSVGGIDVGVSAATSDAGVEFRQGVNHLDGAAALTYVRQRYGLPEGDLSRAQRQQNALRALLSKAASGGMMADPAGLYSLLDATSRTVGVDDSLSNGGLRSLAFEMRGLRPSNVTFLSAPFRGLGQEGAQSVVYLDEARSAELWEALRDGRAATYAELHPEDALGASSP